MTWMPLARSRSASRPASTASPIITGMIGCSPGSRVEAQLAHPAAEIRRVVEELPSQLAGLRQQIEHGQRRGDDHRGDRVGEQVRPRPLAEELDDVRPAADVPAAGAAERLAERTGHDVDPVDDAEQLRRAPAVRADEPDGVRIVDHHHRVVLVRQPADVGQRGVVAVHREHAVGGDHPVAGHPRRP